MDKGDKIYIAGHSGLVGSAVHRLLAAEGYRNILVADRNSLDLRSQPDVTKFFEQERPDVVFLAAGKVGGVYANMNYRVEMLYENFLIESNIIHNAFLAETKKLIYFGCSSMYPRLCPQPMKEEHLLCGEPEPTNEPFALAKLSGLKLCQAYSLQYGCDFISIIPPNLYGINQNYTPLNSLVVPALLRRFHEAKVVNAPEVLLWGSGRPARDFLCADDVADAALFLAQRYSDPAPINIGSGRDITIKELGESIASAVGFNGKIKFDPTKPDGVLSKLQDISKVTAMGWRPKVVFEEGLRIAYQDFVENFAE